MRWTGPERSVSILERACTGDIFTGDSGRDASGFEPCARVTSADVVPDHASFFHLFGVRFGDGIEGGIANEGPAAFGDSCGVDHAQHCVGRIDDASGCFFAGDGCPDKLSGRLLAGVDGSFEDGSGTGGDGGEDLNEPRAGLIDGERGADATAGEGARNGSGCSARSEQDDLNGGGGNEH